MRCEEIDYEIHGNDLQVVEVELDPGETVPASPSPLRTRATSSPSTWRRPGAS